MAGHDKHNKPSASLDVKHSYWTKLSNQDKCHLCDKASVFFCVNEEVALCAECDSSVHEANTIARRHRRVHAFPSQVSEVPACDNCQETVAACYCRISREILCMACDACAHTSESSARHERCPLPMVQNIMDNADEFELVGSLRWTADAKLQSTTVTEVSSQSSDNSQFDILRPCASVGDSMMGSSSASEENQNSHEETSQQEASQSSYSSNCSWNRKHEEMIQLVESATKSKRRKVDSSAELPDFTAMSRPVHHVR
ncbi:hypothetical protein CYMTET_45620 [Cymbomonas tetramitiformis]|uniref:B box-type domain-containing protein n=1 Tax=Cymbomonas tetramitiformis TaxID=36881 RepID=A0AAE0BZN0_9CHLO|nr:hypothetical protein CYMTET_45620 [Cymbomonas tetramitiformis]